MPRRTRSDKGKPRSHPYKPRSDKGKKYQPRTKPNKLRTYCSWPRQPRKPHTAAFLAKPRRKPTTNPGIGSGNHDRSACKYGHLRSKWTFINHNGWKECKACQPRWRREHRLKKNPNAGTAEHPRLRPEKRTTHCIHGHERTEENTGWQFYNNRQGNGKRRIRFCKPCRADYHKRNRDHFNEWSRNWRKLAKPRFEGSPPTEVWEAVLESHGLGKGNEQPYQESSGLHDGMTNDKLPAKAKYTSRSIHAE